MFGVTPASQELVQPPIYLLKPASDAGLSHFDREDRRIVQTLYDLNRRYIVYAYTDQGGPDHSRLKGSRRLRQQRRGNGCFNEVQGENVCEARVTSVSER